jgi:23S rRNA pseudouridine2604 synthase
VTEPGERLAKRVAALVPCSRREAEQYIGGGWVRVDGRVVEEPQFRVQQQVVTLAREASLMDATPSTLLLHKPAGHDDGRLAPDGQRPRPGEPPPARQLLTQARQMVGDQASQRLLKRHLGAHLSGIGRSRFSQAPPPQNASSLAPEPPEPPPPKPSPDS